MTVYVDDPVHPYGRMLMCHCIADTREELLAMMTLIGVQHRRIQSMSTSTSRKGNAPKQSETEQSQSPQKIWSENFDHEELLAQKYRQQGKKSVHLCPDWDFMAIHSLSPEFEACLCDLSALP